MDLCLTQQRSYSLHILHIYVTLYVCVYVVTINVKSIYNVYVIFFMYYIFILKHFLILWINKT